MSAGQQIAVVLGLGTAGGGSAMWLFVRVERWLDRRYVRNGRPLTGDERAEWRRLLKAAAASTGDHDRLDGAA